MLLLVVALDLVRVRVHELLLAPLAEKGRIGELGDALPLLVRHRVEGGVHGGARRGERGILPCGRGRLCGGLRARGRTRREQGHAGGQHPHQPATAPA
jgi:hypothetical protein